MFQTYAEVLSSADIILTESNSQEEVSGMNKGVKIRFLLMNDNLLLYVGAVHAIF